MAHVCSLRDNESMTIMGWKNADVLMANRAILASQLELIVNTLILPSFKKKKKFSFLIHLRVGNQEPVLDKTV